MPFNPFGKTPKTTTVMTPVVYFCGGLIALFAFMAFEFSEWYIRLPLIIGVFLLTGFVVRWFDKLLKVNQNALRPPEHLENLEKIRKGKGTK
jgi:hypothetical protein